MICGHGVLLRHEGYGPSHWDLLWQGRACPITYEQPGRGNSGSGRHFIDYYLTYRGSVSGGRGSVHRIWAALFVYGIVVMAMHCTRLAHFQNCAPTSTSGLTARPSCLANMARNDHRMIVNTDYAHTGNMAP